MERQEYNAKRVLRRPSNQRRIRVTDKNREVRPLGRRSKQAPGLAQFHLGLGAHAAVIRTGSAAPAAP